MAHLDRERTRARRFAAGREYLFVLVCGVVMALATHWSSPNPYDLELPPDPSPLLLDEIASELPPKDAEVFARWSERVARGPRAANPVPPARTVRDAVRSEYRFEAGQGGGAD